jgi:DNA-binding beta-propeller fold protein YncE
MVTATRTTFTYSHTIGKLAQSGAGFNNPYDVAIGLDGQLFVLNRTNMAHAPLGAVRVTICTFDEEYIGQFGNYGDDDGNFIWPVAIARDSQGRIYVSDEKRQDVQIFDANGTFIRKFGGAGKEPDRFNRPSGLAVDQSDNLIVVDHLNNRVQVFNPDGGLEAIWGEAGSGAGQFDLPWGVNTDAQGQVYVADWRNDRVQQFTLDGRYLATFGASGKGEEQLHRPANVAVDGEGIVYVADWGNERVQIFDATGGHLATLRGDSTMVTKWSRGQIESDPLLREQRTTHAERVGGKERLFRGPTAVEVDADGHLVVVDSCRHRLQVYRKES